MTELRNCIAYFAVATAVFAGGSLHSEQTLTITAELMKAPKDGGARRWAVMVDTQLLGAPGGSAAKSETLLRDAIVSNFGCATYAEGVWCEVRSLHGGPRGFAPVSNLAQAPGPDGIVARGINDSARRAKRKKFDATGSISCAQEQGEALGLCKIGVARSGGGDATASVTFSNGFTRLLFFMHGEFTSASATMSGAGRDTDWTVKGDVHLIRADDQRFEIPSEMLFNIK